ncbi:MAG: serine/threonine-protein kinase [Polyangiales bacterium]
MTWAGQRIRDYEIWGRLGEGGMSEVWLAKHAVLGLPVVLKTLRRAIADSDAAAHVHDSEDTTRRFDRMLTEARLMAQIASPRVVRATDAGLHDGAAYVVQEYVDGIDLAELDRRRRHAIGLGLPLWFVCYVMQELLLALQAAHRTGIIHRDIKPSNIFGSPLTGVRLGDFGIAVPSHMTRESSERSGTFRFMPPEQLLGGALGPATDVYGAGATAFDLRYGKPPYEDIRAMLDPKTRPTFPAAKSPSEAFFQHVLAAMLDNEPGCRPRNLGVLARQFGTLSEGLLPLGDRLPAEPIDRHRLRLGGCGISFEVGDIAEAEVDAIVSSAHDNMQMKSGVGEALRLAGGDDIERAALAGGPRALGDCIETHAGTLKARYVMHAVSAWNEVSCVARATHRMFLRADELGLRTLAIPALGTGASRLSMETCAASVSTALRHHLLLGGSRLRMVRFVLRSEAMRKTFQEVAEDALHDGHEPLPRIDFGLEDPVNEVRADAATYLAPEK